MTRHRAALILTGISAAGFFITAALLLSSYSSVVESAGQSPADIAALVPALWLSFTVAMVACGLMVASALRTSTPTPTSVLVLSAAFPMMAGIFFWRFLGFDSASGIFLVVGVLTLAAAVALPPRVDG